ncbi:MAG: DUF2283 domain-containing protein [Acidobacteria bacterium]|nr:DUF2283 domain-containing protein [Verrucomicrobiota bacterium]MBW8824837.1 DUF2283 domain-containing protein [Acidobacteriota bacterium]
MRWTYDTQADAFYAYVRTAPIDRQVETPGGLIVDVDANGEVVGIEVLSPGRDVDFTGLTDLLDATTLRTLRFLMQPFGRPMAANGGRSSQPTPEPEADFQLERVAVSA